MRTFAITTLTIAAAVGWIAGGGLHSAQPSAPPVAVAPVSENGPHSSGGTVVIPRDSEDPHFFVGGDVAGQHLTFVVDTGATTVALSREDAAHVGVDVDHLAFDRQARTASGTAMYAAVTLPRLRVGDIQLMDVPAAVMDVPQGIPLLGQSFLGRLDKVSIEGDRMTLTKN
jgi:aspartyl protease family protein